MRFWTVLLTFVCLFQVTAFSQQRAEPWTPNQLMETTTLANMIKSNKVANTEIISIGPDAIIKGSVNIGATMSNENIKKLKNYLKNIPREKEVVLYCGCCPFNICPNIRPAFKTLKEMGFKNPKLLNIPKNIKVDWLDKNFPTNF